MISQCKTGDEHLASLRDGRSVTIDGAAVPDVTTHKAFRNAVQSAAALYTFQADPENIGWMTFQPEGGGRRINRAWQIPRSHAEMVARRHAMTAWAERSFGFMGRSPDHLASSLAGQFIGLHVFERGNAARAQAFAEYFRHASSRDLFLTYVIINPQADRSKPWGQQADGLVARVVDEDSGGLTIRGAKMLGTSAIMANEVFVANLQPLSKGEEDLAFCCALPMNTKGLRVLSRKSYEAAAVSEYDNPLSFRYDENDALLYFDDVKVPWDRLFVDRDVDLCRAQFHDTAGHIYQNYQSQVRLMVKLRFLVGLARRLTETIGTEKMPQVREQLGRLAASAGMVESMVAGMEAAGEVFKGYWIPNRHHVYAAQVMTQDLYPRLINTIRELAGGSVIMLPSSVSDFADPAVAAIIDRTQRSPVATPEARVRFLKAAWDAIGSEFGSRHTQYEMFYAGAQFVTAGHSYRTYNWDGAGAMVERLLQQK